MNEGRDEKGVSVLWEETWKDRQSRWGTGKGERWL